jgi:hypothetical protein
MCNPNLKALSDEAVVFSLLPGTAICAIRGRFLKSLGGYLAELFDGIVLGFLWRCLRVGLFPKRIIRCIS